MGHFMMQRWSRALTIARRRKLGFLAQCHSHLFPRCLPLSRPSPLPRRLYSTSAPASGRLVLTHSTYMDNLLDVLGHLANVEGIHTITPGVLGRSRAHMEHFQLRVTTPISKGHKLIARKGRSLQEVFVVTTLSKEDLQRYAKESVKAITGK